MKEYLLSLPFPAGSWRRNLRVAHIVFLCASIFYAAGCQRKETSPETPPPATAQVSAIRVKTTDDGILVQTASAEFVLSPTGYLKANLAQGGTLRTLDEPGKEPGQAVRISQKEIKDFSFDLIHADVSDTQGKLGKLGKRVEVHGLSASAGLEESLTLEVYDDFPGLALLSASFRNARQSNVSLSSVAFQQHRLNASLADPAAATHQMWSFDGASLKWGKDETFPLPAKFSEENPFGAPVETRDDLGRVGGGIPVVAFWTKSVGEAIGQIETLPLVLSIPVAAQPDGRVAAAVRLPANVTLKPGETYATPRTFVAVYSGDFYEPLNVWSNAIEREGLTKPANNDENYAITWCGWGYDHDFTPAQMVETIPKLKELGVHWATVDDRWFDNYGDWQPRSDTFPGDAIQKMVATFHSQGMKVQLWWLPLAVEDGHYRYEEHTYGISQVMKQHPDWLILDKTGKPARMARNLATLCPALPEVQDYYKKLTERFVRDWDFDGHKLDNIYSTPPCYNPKHHHKSPYDSVYAMGEVYKVIFETTRALKPNSITQSCPCGTPPSLAWMRYMDQAVTADPVGSVQVRRRIKMYKAILGPRAAIYGDHVELTRMTGANTDNEQDIGWDFASTLGPGGVLGTKFTWPDYGPKFKTVYLTADKDAHWKKWIGLYNEKMLSKGNFLDLYVYGYDFPEAYAIEKNSHLYYAFYAPTKQSAPAGETSPPGSFAGEVELRGLAAGTYKVVDYVNGRDYGTVSGPTAKLAVQFPDFLLLEAIPQAATPLARKN